MTKRFPEGNYNRVPTGACKRHLQVPAVLNLSAKLSELIRDRLHHLPSHVGKKNAGISRNDFRIAQVQKLASYDEPAAARLCLNLNIDLKWVCAIEHLHCANTCRSSSFENGLQKTVEENFDPGARSLSLTCQTGSCECRLGKPYGVFWRLVVLFRSCRLPNSLPHRNGFRAAFAALLQMFLHQLFVVSGNDLVHKVNPLLRCKVFHLFPPDSFLHPEHSPVAGMIHRHSWNKGMQRPNRYSDLKFS